MREHLKSVLYLVFLVATLIMTGVPSLAKETQEETFVAKKSTATTTLIGFTRARARIKLTSQVNDKILEINSDVGDHIGKKGVFARFDTTLPELELENIHVNQDKIRSRIAYLEKEVRRFQVLLDKHSTAEAKLDSLKQELDQAKLSLRELESNEKKAAEFLDRHTVKAEPGWQVIKRMVEPGEWVTAGTPLAEVGNFQVLTVPFAVSQVEYLWLKENLNDISLQLPELASTVKARLKQVSPGFDPVTRKMNIELEITSSLKEKRGGIRAELSIDIYDPSGAILVPTTAITSRYDSSWLTNSKGDRIKVIILGPARTPGYSRVASPEIAPGDIFRSSPTSTTSSAK